MISARQVVLVIQNIPANSKSMPFLISLANNAFKYGALTEKQEIAFNRTIDALKAKEVLA